MSFEKLRQFKNEDLEAENKRLRDVVATLQRAGIIGVGAERLLEAENRQLRDEIKHLMACKEFESNLQNEIIQVGSDFMDEVISGKTYSVAQAWRAIQKALKGLNDAV